MTDEIEEDELLCPLCNRPITPDCKALKRTDRFWMFLIVSGLLGLTVGFGGELIASLFGQREWGNVLLGAGSGVGLFSLYVLGRLYYAKNERAKKRSET